MAHIIGVLGRKYLTKILLKIYNARIYTNEPLTNMMYKNIVLYSFAFNVQEG